MSIVKCSSSVCQFQNCYPDHIFLRSVAYTCCTFYGFNKFMQGDRLVIACPFLHQRYERQICGGGGSRLKLCLQFLDLCLQSGHLLCYCLCHLILIFPLIYLASEVSIPPLQTNFCSGQLRLTTFVSRGSFLAIL